MNVYTYVYLCSDIVSLSQLDIKYVLLLVCICMCVYICMCIFMQVCTCVGSVFIIIYVLIYVVRLHVSMKVYCVTCVGRYICMYVLVLVCMYVRK
jgi:hypothetical protein